MRYELRLTAYDIMSEVCVSAECYGTPDSPDEPIELVWARTEVDPRGDCRTATEWIREALLSMLEAL